MIDIGRKNAKPIVSRRGFLQGAASTASVAMLSQGLCRLAYARDERHEGHDGQHEEGCPGDHK